MHICVCMNICINWRGIYWPKTKVFTKSKARHVWYVLAKVGNDHRLRFFGRRLELLAAPAALLYNLFIFVCHSDSKELTLTLNCDVALNLKTKLLKTTKDVIRSWYLKSIFFISWGLEVAPAGIRILFILTSCQIGSLELEQPVCSWFSALTVYCHRCSFPFQRSIFFFGAHGNEGTSNQSHRGGKTSDFNAVVPHSLILLWRRNRWRKEIYIDFDWILCFVILKGHNYFHCEVFMTQQKLLSCQT